MYNGMIRWRCGDAGGMSNLNHSLEDLTFPEAHGLTFEWSTVVYNRPYNTAGIAMMISDYSLKYVCVSRISEIEETSTSESCECTSINGDIITTDDRVSTYSRF